MEMIKRLTKANCEKYGINFVSDEDGYREFAYKGISLLQDYNAKKGIVDIYVDVFDLKTNRNFTPSEFFATNEGKLCHDISNREGFDVDEFVANLEKIYLKIQEMDETAHVSEEYVNATKQKIRDEISEIETLLQDLKEKFRWWECGAYDLRRIREKMDYWEHVINDGKRYIEMFDTYSLCRKKELIECAKDGRVLNRISEYDLKEIKQFMD